MFPYSVLNPSSLQCKSGKADPSIPFTGVDEGIQPLKGSRSISLTKAELTSEASMDFIEPSYPRDDVVVELESVLSPVWPALTSDVRAVLAKSGLC